MKIVARTFKGKEYLRIMWSSHKVPARSANKIAEALNDARWQLRSEDELWHVYDVDEYDSCYEIALQQPLRIRNGAVYATRAVGYVYS